MNDKDLLEYLEEMLRRKRQFEAQRKAQAEDPSKFKYMDGEGWTKPGYTPGFFKLDRRSADEWFRDEVGRVAPPAPMHRSVQAQPVSAPVRSPDFWSDAQMQDRQRRVMDNQRNKEDRRQWETSMQPDRTRFSPFQGLVEMLMRGK
jgi:hypothetical protein